jgi:hypothetical protein
VKARAARGIAVLVALGGGGAAACQILAGIERIDKVGLVIDAGPDSSVGPAAADPCLPTRPPPPPETDDDRDGVLPPFYLAVRTFTFNKPDGADFGFDLDGTCTCDKRVATAHDGGSSCKPAGNDCDLDGGIDNEASKLFASLVPIGFSVDQLVNDDVSKGQSTLLIYVSQYNGKPNDTEVLVGGLVSDGILDGAGCGTVLNVKRNRAPPAWCGHDLWTYPTDYVKPGTAEPLGTGTGYVTNGVLVFTGDLPLSIAVAGNVLGLGSPIGAGQLLRTDAGTWAWNGTMTGRVAVSQVLAMAGNFNTSSGDGGTALCQSLVFPTIKAAACSSVDITRSSRFDFQDGTCDSVSMAVGFEADQVDIGQRFDPPPPDQPCAADHVTPGTYACP